MSKKRCMIYNIVICFLVLLCSITIGINFAKLLKLSKIDELFIISGALFIVGILCLIFLIKKLFHWLYLKLNPIVYKAEEWAQAKVVSELKAYKSLRVTNITIFSIVLLLQIIEIIIYL